MHDKAIDRQLVDCPGAERFSRLRYIIRPNVKRLLDITVSIFLIIVISPLLLLIMLVLSGTGQVPLYRHVRIGRCGREFGCLKFRSMRRDADAALTELLERDLAAKVEWEATRKMRRDPRITRVGKVLRATSLDELPQLFNILVGQMSLVGPRPVTQDEFAKFYGPIEAAAYASVRPGLTGLWQVSGRSGTCFTIRVALDARYAQTLSLRTDAVILFQTLNVVVRRKGAW